MLKDVLKSFIEEQLFYYLQISKSTKILNYESDVFYPKTSKSENRLAYLNDTDTHTDFMHQELSIKPETPKLVISHILHIHTVRIQI